jgi:hypothetical protein
VFLYFWDWAWEAVNPEVAPLKKTVNTGYVKKNMNQYMCVCYLLVLLSVYILHLSIWKQIVFNKNFLWKANTSFCFLSLEKSRFCV